VKNEKDEPKEYFERNILVVIAIVAISVSLDWLTLHFLFEVNPWGTATAIPGIILSFQSIWLIVQPYAIVFEDRFEIKQSLFYNKHFYFLDAKALKSNGNLSFFMVYNDDELEKLPLLGIRTSHKEAFRQKLQDKINFSLKNRTF
jgi:hypothetical protein